MRERDYIRGQRSVWLKLLSDAVSHLGLAAKSREQLMVEREQTIAALRSVCEDFGDNDWEDNAYLPDVIEKHLARTLHAKRRR